MRLRVVLVLLVLSVLHGPAAASTEFTYQGQLRTGGAPSNGTFNLTFELFDAVTAGNQVSSTVAVNGVAVANGLFTVALDFGAKAFPGLDRWLEVAVQGPGDAGFTILAPRQKLTATPYALALPNLRTEASQNGPSFLSANVIGGSTVNTVAAGITGAVIAGGGATNGFPQQISANYSSIGGGYSNTIGPSASQSVIAGGVGNNITASGGTIGGGQSNTASSSFATVSGGQSNTASGSSATIPGGFANNAGGSTAFAAGNRAKAIHPGAFVWGDSTNADVSSTANDQVVFRASGGVVLTADAGNFSSVPVGMHYRDNAVFAWGRVSSNGAIADSFNVANVGRNSAGNYTVTLNASVTGTALVPIVTVAYAGSAPTTAATMRIASTGQPLSSSTFNVYINSGTFAPADADFSFIVTGR